MANPVPPFVIAAVTVAILGLGPFGSVICNVVEVEVTTLLISPEASTNDVPS